jgi:hypothetical protein
MADIEIRVPNADTLFRSKHFLDPRIIHSGDNSLFSICISLTVYCKIATLLKIIKHLSLRFELASHASTS